jgi:uncharacterized membrane protein YadS
VVVKLFRVLMLLPTILIVTAWLTRRSAVSGARGRVQVPGFAFGFLALVVLNSAGLVPDGARQGLTLLSQWGLVVAIAALGMNTSLRGLGKAGARRVGIAALSSAAMAGAIAAMLLVTGAV